MKNVNYLIGLLAITFQLVSCSANKSVTNTQFVFGNLVAPGATQSGGIVIIGRNVATGEEFNLKLDNELEKKQAELSRGPWSFVVVGWDGDINADSVGDGAELEGKTRCGFANVELNQPEQTLQLVINQANCLNPVFGPYTATTGNINGVKLSNCLYSQGECKAFGPYRSYKVKLQMSNGELLSRCVTHSNYMQRYVDTNSTATAIRVPFLDPSLAHLPVDIQGWDSSDCTGTMESHPVDNLRSFIPGIPTASIAAGTILVQLSGAEICTAERIAKTPFATGNFYDGVSTAMDNIICSVSHLANIGTGTSGLMNGSYVLASSIDGTSYGVISPVGTTTAPFRGKFSGLGNLISNVDVNGTSNVGIFGVVGVAGTATAKLEKIKLEHINVTGTSSSVGTLIGDAQAVELSGIVGNNLIVQNSTGNKSGGLIGSISGSYSRLSNINVSNITIAAADNVGGVIGSALNLTSPIFRVDVSNVTINSTPSVYGNIAGVIGEMSGSSLTEASLTGLSLTANGGVGPVGGMIGSMTGTSNADFLKMYGLNTITQNGSGSTKSVGGLVGSITGSSALHNARTNVTILGDMEMIGGAVGYFSASSPGVIVGVTTDGSLTCTATASMCGGLVGKFDALSVSVPQLLKSSSTMSVSGVDNLGGAIGKLTNGIVSDIVVTGNISGTGNSIGGFVGYAVTGTSPVEISGSVAKGNANGNMYVGGFIGQGAISASLFLMENYATGIASASTSYTNFEGYINNPASVLSSPLSNYYAFDGSGNLSSMSGKTASIASASMTASASFANFDFANRWIIVPGQTPVQRWKYAMDSLGNKLGSSNDPFEICTPSDFNLISDNPRFMRANFVQICDLDFTSTAINMIGSSTTPFMGSYFAYNKIISGVTINQAGQNDIGIFRSIDGAQIGGTPAKLSATGLDGWLFLKAVDVTGTSSVGALVGSSAKQSNFQKSLITNVYLDSLTIVNGWGTNVGGVVGTTQQTILDNIETHATVHGNSAVVGVGGIVGKASALSEITGVRSYGVIDGLDQVGGIVGNLVSGKIDDGINYGSVSSNGTAGGIVGYSNPGISGTSINLVSNLSANITTASSAGTGGIAGSLTGVMMSNCLVANSTITGSSIVGGVVGAAATSSTSIMNCLVYNTTATTSTATNVGTFVGYRAATPTFANMYTNTATTVDDPTTTVYILSNSVLTSGADIGLGTLNWIYSAGQFPALNQ